MVAPRVFLDFALDGTPVGRVVFELFNISAPKTAENFRALCTGERGVSPISQISLYYKHSKMHRVIPDFMIQGGDFTKGNGTGGESIYGGPFPDEDLSRPVDEPGLLVMANKGPNTNNSQFFITLQPSPHLTGKHVVFGRVIRGFNDVIKRIADVPTDEKDRPTVPVEVANCGELELRLPPTRKSPVKEESEGESKSEGEDESERGRKRRRRRSGSRSRSLSESLSRSRSRSHNRSEDEETEAEAKRHKYEKRARKEKKEKKSKKSSKKSKKRKHNSLSHSRSRSRSLSPHSYQKGAPREETEEEYDARLEREERERIEAARLAKLAEMKRRHEAELEKVQADSGGVVFKGRGRMKYVDPESRSRR